MICPLHALLLLNLPSQPALKVDLDFLGGGLTGGSWRPATVGSEIRGAASFLIKFLHAICC